MTEEDAKTKWCPFALKLGTLRQLGAEDDVVIASGSQNRGWAMGGPIPECMCIGSACMAWRWLGTHDKNPDDPQGDLIWTTRTHGTCGLAGSWYQNMDRNYPLGAPAADPRSK